MTNTATAARTYDMLVDSVMITAFNARSRHTAEQYAAFTRLTVANDTARQTAEDLIFLGADPFAAVSCAVRYDENPTEA